jgi:uncharacterized glyoxalase superfamily protein PhnB
MVQNPPPGTQRVIPYLLYADADAAIEFLCAAFGFEERMRFPLEDGSVGHAELGLEDNVLMLATALESLGAASQRDLPARSAMLLCYVDDVDAHYSRAQSAGAKVLGEPKDQFYGDRSYQADDLEGHRWCFSTHVKDVPLEDMAPPA